MGDIFDNTLSETRVRNMRIKFVIGLGAVILIVIIWFMRGEKTLNSENLKEPDQQTKAFPVDVTRGIFEDVEHTLEAVGSFFPEDEVTVGAEEDGVIKKLWVDEGSPVKKGDLLLEIDDEKFRLEVEESQASLKRPSPGLKTPSHGSNG